MVVKYLNWDLELFAFLNLIFFITLFSGLLLIIIVALRNRPSDSQIIDFKLFITEWGRAHQLEGTIEEWIKKNPFWSKFLKMNYRIGKGLTNLGFSPNMITTIGLILCLFSGWFIILGGISWILIPPLPIELILLTDIKRSFVEPGVYFIIAGIIYIFSGLVDGFDGAVARVSNRITKFGAIYDNMIDKYSDLAVFGSIIIVGLCDPVIGFLAIIGFFLVEYARAFGESRGVKKTIPTLAERPVRLIFISIFFFVLAGHLIALKYYIFLPYSTLNFYLIDIGMIILVFFAHSSVIFIVYHLKKETSKLEEIK
ncbi:MAG: CDP-alcohol phosphatidyltransferase family protein [Candidatus Hodarchaeota archaeon]